MRIDWNGITSDPTITERDNKSTPNSTPADANIGEDTASLASTPDNVKALASDVLAAPPIRQEKVDALRQAVSTGQYKIEPDKVAEAILQDATNKEFPS